MGDSTIWRSVPLDKIFTYVRGTEKNMSSLAEGDVPLVSARSVNNGVKGFVGNPSKRMTGGSVITLNNDGDGGAGLAYYQPADFALDTHVTALEPRERTAPESLLYMTASISKQHAVFGHGRSISLRRAERLQDMLPVTHDGNPDYAYMAKYVRERRKAMLTKYHSYVAKRIAELGKMTDIPLLKDKTWAEFPLEELFSVGAGKRLTNADKVDGTRPFIGAADHGNGVTGFVGNDNASRDSNVLGVNYNGAPCIAFYHPYECVFTDDVKRLHLLHYTDNAFVLLFFQAIIMQQQSKYGYGYKFNERRMLRQKLMVPVNASSDPDYEYMEQYARNMMLRKYEQYASFLDAGGEEDHK